MTENIPYLLLSVSLSSGRNLISKKTAVSYSGLGQFFFSQTLLFGCAAVLMLIFGITDLINASSVTWVYGGIYGILLLISQWMFTLALKNGAASVCTVIYSLGFIIPTLVGTYFWNEDLTIFSFLGILVAVLIILLSAKKEKTETSHGIFIPFILVAMTASGGLGIMQKVQQSSAFAEEKEGFLAVAFFFAFIFSLVAFLIFDNGFSFSFKSCIPPALTGVCFGGANLFNTILAGRMSSAVFFPLQNVSVILLTAVLSLLFFRERLTLRTGIILLLGIGVIILFSL